MMIPGAPRFGWFEPTHRALNLGAINQLPGRTPKGASWKSFLQDNFTRLITADSLRDIQYDGPTHYTDVKERGNTTALSRSLYNVPGYQLWQEAKKAFTKKNLAALQAELQENQLVPGNPSDPPSLFQNLQEAYATVRKELDRYAEGLPRMKQVLNGDPAHDNPLIQAAKDDLLDNLGWLAHMVGDASMPLHTASAHGDWPLNPTPKMPAIQFSDGIHHFLEGDVFDDADHQALIDQAQSAPELKSAFYNQPDLFEQVLAPQLVESYKLNREILQAHQEALKGENGLDRPLLQARLREILTPHLQKAQHRLAWVLHSVWKQAGEPQFELSVPTTESKP